MWPTLLLVVAGAAPEDPPYVPGSSTLVVLPDTERYSDDYPQHFLAQTAWIADAREARDVAYVVHLGDVTQHNAPAEWGVARRAFDALDGETPYALAAGNHDYDGNAPDRPSSRLGETFPAREFERWPTFGGLFEPGRMENCFHLLRLGGQDWILVVLEMGPRDEVVAWANAVLDRHANRRALLVTHAYLFRDNARYDHTAGQQRASPHTWGNDGEELWQKLVRRHPNLMLVVSGHVSTGGLGYLASQGDYGNTVHQMMVDYEKLPEGGLGFLRLLEFLPDGETVHVRTYSPSLGESRRSELEDFTFRLAGPTRARALPAGPQTGTGGAPLARPPVHRYTFDGRGGDGATIEDVAGGAHGVLVAADGASALDGAGRLTLLGDGHVRLPPGLLAGHDELSIEAWFTPTAERYRWNSVVRLGDAEDWITYVFRTLDVHRAEIAVARHNEDIQRDIGARPGRAQHVVVTYSGGAPARLAWFHDGERVGDLRTGLRLGDVDDDASTFGPFEGTFDEVRLYDHALSAAEVRGSRQAGPGRLGLTEAAPAPDVRAGRVARVVFDTDMDTDCDDAGALAMLHALADRGEVEILATVVSSRYSHAAPCVEAINAWFGRPALPIGVPKGAGASTSRGSRYARVVAGEHATRLATNDDAPDATAVYRRVLAAQPDASVVIVTVGYLTNLRDLLATGPDEISALSGRELVARKVSRWVCMGGRYPAERDPGVHGNFKPDPVAAVTAIRDWPGVIHFSGIGKTIQTGRVLRAESPPEHPVRRAYDLYLGERATRPSWDQVALLHAVRPDAPYWSLARRGSNHVFPNGTNEWRPGDADPRHVLIELEPDARPRVTETIEELMAHVPDCRR